MLKKTITKLEQENVAVIKQSFQEFFSDQDKLWIYGPCVNIKHKGNDIDLFVETQETDYDTVLRQKNDLASALREKFNDRPIEIVVKIAQEDLADLPIYTIAKGTGVRLV